MKKIQKIMSFVLVLVLVLSATVAIIPASAEETAATTAENLIVNGDFESSTEGWYWHMGTTTDYVYEGTSALIMNDGTATYKPAFTSVKVEPYTDYTYSFWYYAPVGGDWVSAWYVNGAPANVDRANPKDYLKEIESETVDGSTLAKGTFTQCEEGEWIQATATVNSGRYEVLIFAFYTNADNDDGDVDVQLYVDNASLTVVPNEENGNAIKNGGFERQRANWGAEYYGLGDINADRIVSDNVNSGTYSAKVPSGYNHFIYTKFDCIKNTDYVLEFYTVNASGVNYAISPTIDTSKTGMFRDANSTPEGTILKRSITNTSTWNLNRIEFNSGENTRLYLAFYNTGDGKGTIRIDDVSVKKSSYNNNIFKNGDFENGSILVGDYVDRKNDVTNDLLWYRPEGDTSFNGNNTNTASTDLAYTGERSLKIASNAAGQYYAGVKLYKNFKVEKNTNYYISYYYNVKLAGGADICSVVGATDCYSNDSGTVIAKLGSNGGTTVLTNAATDGWVKVSALFNSGENEMLRLVFRTTKLNSELEMYVDDISVTKYTDGNKIIQNGSFEYGAYKWDVNSGGKISTDEYYEGKASLKLSTTQWNKASQQVTLDANTDYIASFYYKGYGNFKWGISTTTSPDNKISSAGASLNGGSEWKYVRVLFNTGDNTDLYFSFMSSSSNIDVYIDNVEIVLDPNPEDGLVVNGGFELDTYNWSTGGGTVVTEDGGNSAFKLSKTDYSKAHQLFNVAANTNYIVEFYYKGTASWMNKWGVGTTDGVESNQRISGGSLSTVTDWTRAYAFFNSGDNTSLYFSVMSGSGADMYIDNVKVYLDPNPEDGLVVNGGFELDTSNWTTNGGTISTDEYYEGKASLKLSTTQWNKASQQFAVEPNTDYVASYWYKGNAYSRWGVATTTGVEPDQRIAGGDIHSTNGEWKRAYVFFNSGDNTSLYFNVMSGSNDIEIYIDNVNVALVEAGDANGDGYKNATDLTVLKKVLLGENTTHSTTGCKVRGEDTIDIRDLIRLKKDLVSTAE